MKQGAIMVLAKCTSRSVCRFYYRLRTWSSFAYHSSSIKHYKDLDSLKSGIAYHNKNGMLSKYTKPLNKMETFLHVNRRLLHKSAFVLKPDSDKLSTLQPQQTDEVQDDLIFLPPRDSPGRRANSCPVVTQLIKQEVLVLDKDSNTWYISASHLADYSILRVVEAVILQDHPTVISLLDRLIFRYAMLCDKRENHKVVFDWFQNMRRQNRVDMKAVLWFLDLWIEKMSSFCGEAEIFKIHEDMKQDSSEMPSLLLSKFIEAYAKTSRRDDCFKMYEELRKALEITQMPIERKLLRAMVRLSIENQSLHEMQMFLKAYYDCLTDKTDMYRIYQDIVSCCEKRPSQDVIESVFEFQRNHWLYPEEHAVLSLIRCLQQSTGPHKWTVKKATLDNRNVCSRCQAQLEDTHLTPEEFQELQNVVLQSMVKRNDVYYNSTPAEYQKFLQFMERGSPYDFIIDGLNVFFFRRAHQGYSADMLKAMIRKINRGGNKRILVIARHHLRSVIERNFPQDLLEGRNVQFYYCDKLSSDDTFLIHAAFRSGPNTMIVTNDILQNHMAYMENFQMQDLFERWRLLHQMKFTTLSVQYPKKPKPRAQKDENGWHIPYSYTQSKFDKDGRTYSRSPKYVNSCGYFCIRKELNE